jgi:septum formation protein
MIRQLLLASASQTRLSLLRAAGVDTAAHPVKIDEETIRASLAGEGATPRDMADTLAQMKAAKLAAKHPDALVLGCDQTLDFNGICLGKPDSIEDARHQLTHLRGKKHALHSALVIFDKGEPVWCHIGTARLTMRDFSDDYLDAYLSRNWPEVSHSVGGYMIEAEGIRLFSAVDGDYPTILGLPLLPLLLWLSLRGFIPS